MRTLLVAAAVALSMTVVQAQEMVGEKPAATAVQAPPERAVPAVTPMPTSAIIEQLKAAGELKDTKALEAPAPKIDAADTKPVEARPVEAAPAVARPVEAAKPAETKAVETKAAETRPALATEAEPAKKRIVRKRETNEEKARRIAAKYGIHW